jgi:hypothetical protein
MHRSKKDRYSITSSARARSPAKAHFLSANIQMVFGMGDRKNRWRYVRRNLLKPRPRLHRPAYAQSIHKPKPEAGLDVRQTVGGQSG